MGLELMKATVINIYKTLAITGYPLSWPSKLIMSATQHSLYCTSGAFWVPLWGGVSTCCYHPWGSEAGPHQGSGNCRKQDPVPYFLTS